MFLQKPSVIDYLLSADLKYFLVLHSLITECAAPNLYITNSSELAEPMLNMGIDCIVQKGSILSDFAPHKIEEFLNLKDEGMALFLAGSLTEYTDTISNPVKLRQVNKFLQDYYSWYPNCVQKRFKRTHLSEFG